MNTSNSLGLCYLWGVMEQAARRKESYSAGFTLLRFSDLCVCLRDSSSQNSPESLSACELVFASAGATRGELTCVQVHPLT